MTASSASVGAAADPLPRAARPRTVHVVIDEAALPERPTTPSRNAAVFRSALHDLCVAARQHPIQMR